jgi:hypothetical protein
MTIRCGDLRLLALAAVMCAGSSNSVRAQAPSPVPSDSVVVGNDNLLAPHSVDTAFRIAPQFD